METGVKVMATKKEKWDGRSRPSNKAYDKGYERIFGKKEEYELKESYRQSLKNKKERGNYSNPVAAAVRTPKFRSKVIKNKKKDDYFSSKSVKQMMDEME